jgi:hypothetical protein
MYHLKVIHRISTALLLVLSLSHAPVLFAQKIIESSEQSAGFVYATDESVSEPVIHFQQNIDMLAGTDDRVSLQVFGNGRVLVHYPVYMKKAGDYEMQLADRELVALIGELAKDGIIDFDETKVKQAVSEEKKSARAKGELYAVSDAVETVIVIRLDEYQKNSFSPKIKKLKKTFRWKNIEQDAAHYKNNKAILKANDSVAKIKGLMNDQRLLKKGLR